jgi:hypothetical protein
MPLPLRALTAREAGQLVIHAMPMDSGTLA